MRKQAEIWGKKEMAEKISLRLRDPESDDNNSCGVLESIELKKGVL